MRCPACGEENRDDARICGLCRELFVKPAVTSPPPPRPSSSPSRGPGLWVTVVWIVAGAAVLAVGAGAFQRWRKGATPAAEETVAEVAAPEKAPVTRPAAPRRPATRTAAVSATNARPESATPRAALVEEAPTLPAASLPVSSQWYEGADGFRRAQEEQRRVRAPMLLYFRVDWCPYCQRLDKEVLSAAAVTRFLTDVIKVRVNPERSPQDKALAQSHGVDGYPYMFVIPRAEARAQRISGFTRSGADAPSIDVTAEKFVKACTEVGLGQSRQLVREGAEKARAGDLAGARADLDRAVDLDPQNAAAFLWRGHIELNVGENAKAIGYFKRAIDLDPRGPYPYGVLASLYARNGQLDEAIDYLTRLMRVAPEEQQGAAFAMRGRAHQQKGETARASADYAEACRRGQTGACSR